GRAVDGEGPARGRRPLLRTAVDKVLRCRVGARPAGCRANRVLSGLAQRLPAAAERRLRPRRVPPPRASRRVRACEAGRDRRVRSPAQAAPPPPPPPLARAAPT